MTFSPALAGKKIPPTAQELKENAHKKLQSFIDKTFVTTFKVSDIKHKCKKPTPPPIDLIRKQVLEHQKNEHDKPRAKQTNLVSIKFIDETSTSPDLKNLNKNIRNFGMQISLDQTIKSQASLEEGKRIDPVKLTKFFANLKRIDEIQNIVGRMLFPDNVFIKPFMDIQYNANSFSSDQRQIIEKGDKNNKRGDIVVTYLENSQNFEKKLENFPADAEINFVSFNQPQSQEIIVTESMAELMRKHKVFLMRDKNSPVILPDNNKLNIPQIFTENTYVKDSDNLENSADYAALAAFQYIYFKELLPDLVLKNEEYNFYNIWDKKIISYNLFHHGPEGFCRIPKGQKKCINTKECIKTALNLRGIFKQIFDQPQDPIAQQLKSSKSNPVIGNYINLDSVARSANNQTFIILDQSKILKSIAKQSKDKKESEFSKIAKAFINEHVLGNNCEDIFTLTVTTEKILQNIIKERIKDRIQKIDSKLAEVSPEQQDKEEAKTWAQMLSDAMSNAKDRLASVMRPAPDLNKEKKELTGHLNTLNGLMEQYQELNFPGACRAVYNIASTGDAQSLIVPARRHFHTTIANAVKGAAGSVLDAAGSLWQKKNQPSDQNPSAQKKNSKDGILIIE